jgi:tRNA pseudouridine32 synthase/23S rRNA pseudouridine746 synthase
MKIVHADEAIVVVDKPAGLLSVPGRGPDKQDCASARVQAQFTNALIVHRLDQATSGLLLFARGAEMQRALSADFAERRVEKRYLAVVAGTLHAQGWQLIDLSIGADWPNRPKQQVDHTHGKPSQTRWRVLGPEGSHTRLELEPLTGRTHQLRVHLAAIGHPILGDSIYAPEIARRASPRLCLHANHLALPERGWAFDCPAEF